MAKKSKKANVCKSSLPHGNAYSVLTLVLTLAILFLAVGAIVGVPYFYFLVKGNPLLDFSTPIMFEDLIGYVYYYIGGLINKSADYSGVLSPAMLAFEAAIISNPGIDGWLSITLSILLVVGGVFTALFLIIAIIKFAITVKGFITGNNKTLRLGSRSVGTMIFLAFFPAFAINILFAIINEPVANTLVAFFIMIFALTIELVNANVYKKYLKGTVSAKDVKESVEEIKEVENTCPVCGQPVSDADTVCKNCGTNLIYNSTPSSDLGEAKLGHQQESIASCSCCCGCCDEEHHEEKVETNIEELKQDSVKEVIKEEPKDDENEALLTENEDVKVVVVNQNGPKLVDPHPSVVENNTRRVIKVVGLPLNLKELSDHRFSKNGQLQVARIPSNITELGVGCFANCYNLEEVFIPISIKKICANALFACQKLRKITYEGTIAQFRKIERQTNWLTHAGTNVITCADGNILIQ